MSTQDVATRVAKAKSSLVIEQPFIASIICSMPLHIDETLAMGTLATNGECVRIHPQWVRDHTHGELIWALGHETMHCVFRHFLQANIGSRDLKGWNIAADVVINALLETQHLGRRPSGVIWEPDLYARGKTTEGVYELLPKECEGGSGGGDGPGQWDEVEAFKGDPSQQAEAAAKWAVKIAQAAAAAKMCGHLSADMEQFIGSILQPKVHWQDQLRAFFTKRARVEHSWARPNRRFMSQGLYLPGRSGVTLGPVLLAVDLSGSVTPAELDEFVVEMRAIKEDCKPSEIHVTYFASEVMGYEHFSQDDELDLHPRGTGGTAFSPIFRYAEDHDLRPDAGIVLTDLYCNDFGPPPEYPVMWASTGQRDAPWGEVIMLRPGQ